VALFHQKSPVLPCRHDRFAPAPIAGAKNHRRRSQCRGVDTDMPARVRPDARDRVQGDCRRERAPPCGARQRRNGTKRWNAKARKGRNRRDTRWRRDQIHFSRNGRSRCGERPHAQNGRSRATQRAEAASGACRNKEPVQPGSTLSDTADILVDSERASPSRSSLGPQAPQARGAQRRSGDAERLRSFRDGNGHRWRADIEFCSAVTGVRSQRGRPTREDLRRSGSRSRT